MALGRYDRARDYLQLVSGTEYEKGSEVEILLREGKQDEAVQNLKLLPTTAFYYGRQFLDSCLRHPPRSEGAVAAQQVRSAILTDGDPFPKYLHAGWASLCGQPDLAYLALRRAIAQNYCAYPQMATDPLLARVRAMPEFAEIRSLGIACQQQFLEHRKQSSSE